MGMFQPGMPASTPTPSTDFPESVDLGYVGGIETFRSKPMIGANTLAYLKGISSGYRNFDKFMELKNTGLQVACIVPIRQMATATSTTIDNIITTNDDVIQGILNAKKAGLRVVLKPHLDVTDGTFRGDIAPTNWDTWFNNYHDYLMEIAQIGQQYGAELIFIGTELRSATDPSFKPKWQWLASEVRSVFTGKLSYCALCSQAYKGYEAEEFNRSTVWEYVDVLGVSMYFRMADTDTPTVNDLVGAWGKNMDNRDIVGMMFKWSQKWGKPVVFGEVGCSTTYGHTRNLGQSRTPTDGFPVSVMEQANYIESLLKVWLQTGDWFYGFLIWNFHTDSGSLYTINGMPAVDVIRKYMNTKALETASLSTGAIVGGKPFDSLSCSQLGKTQDTDPTSSTYWACLGQVKITKLLDAAVSYVAFMNGQHATQGVSQGYNIRGTFFLRVKQQAAFGSDPIVQLTLDSAVGIDESGLVAVVTEKASDHTTVQIFMKNRVDFDSIFYQELAGGVLYTGQRLWFPAQNVSALPAGTQFVSTLREGNFSKLLVNGEPIPGESVKTYLRYDATSQALTAATFTKMNYVTRSSDNLNEWDAANKQFVPLDIGTYQVIASIRFDAQTSGSTSSLRVQVHRDASGESTMEQITVQSSNTGVVQFQVISIIKITALTDRIYAEGYNSLGATTSTLSRITIARL